jgi:hypothetical protein
MHILSSKNKHWNNILVRNNTRQISTGTFMLEEEEGTTT